MTTDELLTYIAAERVALVAYYPLPSPVDCLRYALTELGEYEDAILRTERQTDKRNNGRARDWQAELGQCGEMIGAAFVQLDGWEAAVCWLSGVYRTDRQELVGKLAVALGWQLRRATCARDTAIVLDAWLSLCRCHELDPADLLRARYAQVRQKHANRPTAPVEVQP